MTRLNSGAASAGAQWTQWHGVAGLGGVQQSTMLALWLFACIAGSLRGIFVTSSSSDVDDIHQRHPPNHGGGFHFLPTAPATLPSSSGHGKHSLRGQNDILSGKQSKQQIVFLPTPAVSTLPGELPPQDQLSTPPGPGLTSTTTPMSSSVLEATPQVQVTDVPNQMSSRSLLHAPPTTTTISSSVMKAASPQLLPGRTSPGNSSNAASATPHKDLPAALGQDRPSWPPSLDEILEVWEPRSVAARWSGWLRALQDPDWGGIGASPDHPSWRNCSGDVAAYLDDLRAARGWAVMLSDASGRYPRGMFDGNGYWLGSRALCSDLDPSTRVSGVPFHRHNVDLFAPFPLAFFVAKLAVNVTSADLRLNQRSTLGLCLPASCSPTDVSRLLKAAIRYPDAVRLLRVRQLQEHYPVWTDPTFLVLMVTGALALLLTGTATILEAILERREAAARLRGAGAAPEAPAKPPRLARGCDIIRKLKGDGAAAPAPAPAWRLVVCCLSLRANLRRIFSLQAPEHSLVPVHGLRVVSLLWVILAHVSLIVFQLADNKDFRAKAEADFLYQVLSSGTFSVDTFFFLSGLLLSYMYHHSCAGQPLQGRAKGFRQFGGMLLYRFLRLTPPYLFVLGAVQVAMQVFQASAVTELPSRDHVTCPQYWWRNLLYIHTFYPNRERCMTWSWYLAADTQFYIIGAALLIMAASYFWAAVGAVFVFLLSSWVTTAVVAYSAHHVANFKEPFALYDELYDKPWTRMGPYLIGMSTGWALWRTRCQIRIHPVAAAAGWLAAGVVLLGCVFGPYGAVLGVELGPAASASLAALSHSAWALAVAWVLVACLSGRGGWVAGMLGWRGLLPASRLCYCAYLLHPLLIRSMALHADSAFHMSRDHIAVLFVGFCVSSFCLALVLSLALEAPVVALLGVLRPHRTPHDPHGPPPPPHRVVPAAPVPRLPESWKTAGFGY